MSATDPHHATDQALHRTIEAVWRIESARVIGGLTRLTRDVGLAEDLAPILSKEQIQHKVERRAALPNQTANKQPRR